VIGIEGGGESETRAGLAGAAAAASAAAVPADMSAHRPPRQTCQMAR